MGKLAAIAGSNLRALRRAKKLSLESLAALSGVDVKYVGQIERGEANCTLAVLERLADALDADPADLLRSPGTPSRPPDPRLLLARLDETVLHVREALSTYLVEPRRKPRKR